MTSADNAGLIARIRQLSPRAAVRDQPTRGSSPAQDERLQALEARLAHLEALVEGLQDSMYRESERHAKLIAELQAQVQPGAMGAALADDARNRGL